MTRWPLTAWLAIVLTSPLVAWGVVWAGKPITAQGFWPVMWVLVGSPMLEEWVYRGVVQPMLADRLAAYVSGFAGHAANLLTALLFVAVHSTSHGVWAWAWLVPALLLGELLRQTQRVWLCVCLHSWFNLALWAVGQYLH